MVRARSSTRAKRQHFQLVSVQKPFAMVEKGGCVLFFPLVLQPLLCSLGKILRACVIKCTAHALTAMLFVLFGNVQCAGVRGSCTKYDTCINDLFRADDHRSARCHILNSLHPNPSQLTSNERAWAVKLLTRIEFSSVDSCRCTYNALSRE